MSKTLYIGLGGLGGRTVLRIKRQQDALPARQQDLFFIIDRDPADCDRLYAGRVPFLCLSANKRVKDYLAEYAALGVENWVPVTPPLLHAAVFTAPQRAVAALTFLDAQLQNRLEPLEDRIDQMISEELPAELKFVIVAGLSGSTGSGIFLRTALWLRHLLRKKTDIPCRIHAVLAGPETLLRGYEVHLRNPEEGVRQRSNAYAAMKELDLLCGVAAGTLPRPEIRPDAVLDAAEKLSAPLFDSVTVYDAGAKTLPYDACVERIADHTLLRHSITPPGFPVGGAGTILGNALVSSSDPATCPILTSEACKEAYRRTCQRSLQTQNEETIPHTDKRWMALWN